MRYVRVEHIVGRKAVTPEQAAENKRLGKRPRAARTAIEPRIPVSLTSWEIGVREGRFPKPVLLGRLRVWREDDIQALEQRISRGELGGRGIVPPRQKSGCAR